jgi:UDP-N-acetyl-D-galactosamine dehydrogenase
MKVAEAAKVIENTQRDLNIALVNELAIIFRHMGIDTLDVLEAAGSKWNFLPFRPGLVGGHCIGVDPYYLTHKAEQLGYHPQVVLAGRRINDGMGRWVVEQLVLEMARRGHVIAGSKVLVLGLSFKENCPDLRNTRVVDVIAALQCYGLEPMLVDPWVDPDEARREYGLEVLATIPAVNRYKGVIAAVAHKQFVGMPEASWRELLQTDGVLLDLKGVMPRALQPLRL